MLPLKFNLNRFFKIRLNIPWGNERKRINYYSCFHIMKFILKN